MRNASYSSVNPENGDVTFKGSLETMKGDHTKMPPRTEAYLPGDERGHVNASSLGGINDTANVVAQNKDVNHRGYRSAERGETKTLNNGASINSEKTAIVGGKVGDRPNTFLVNDSITYPDGHVETVHLSFTNESYATQDSLNEQSSALPGTYEAPNPNDGLRDTMTPEEYTELMEETDPSLPNIADEYEPSDFSGLPDSVSNSGAKSDTVAPGSGEPAGTSVSSGLEDGVAPGNGEGDLVADDDDGGVVVDDDDGGVVADDDDDGSSSNDDDGGPSSDSD